MTTQPGQAAQAALHAARRARPPPPCGRHSGWQDADSKHCESAEPGPAGRPASDFESTQLDGPARGLSAAAVLPRPAAPAAAGPLSQTRLRAAGETVMAVTAVTASCD